MYVCLLYGNMRLFGTPHNSLFIYGPFVFALGIDVFKRLLSNRRCDQPKYFKQKYVQSRDHLRNLCEFTYINVKNNKNTIKHEKTKSETHTHTHTHTHTRK